MSAGYPEVVMTEVAMTEVVMSLTTIARDLSDVAGGS